MIISSIISYQVQDNYELPEQTLLRKKQNEKAINANNRVCDHEVPAIHTPMHNIRGGGMLRVGGSADPGQF